MKRHVPLVLALLCIACGDGPTSPTSTSSTLEPPADPTSTMRGEVRDTTNLPISGAQVQVVAPSRGTVAVTDGNGQFVLPWPFSGTVTVRASKEGFHARERPVPEPGSPRRPVFLGFDLEAIDSPIVVAGMYQMTLTAANECTQLPNVARRSRCFIWNPISLSCSAGDVPVSQSPPCLDAPIKVSPRRT